MNDFSSVMHGADSRSGDLVFQVDDNWSQGRTLYGGIQGALAVRAMRELLGESLPLRSLEVTFVGPVEPGEVVTRARFLRRGRTATHVQAEIMQDESVNLTAVGIFGARRESEVADVDRLPAPDLSLDEAVPMDFIEGAMPNFMRYFEVRGLEPLKFFSGAKFPRAACYARHAGDDSLTWEHLTALGDIAPPVIMASLSRFAPASSMNWQLDFVQPVEKLADPWLRVETRLLSAVDGYVWQDASFWDSDNQLVMLSRQCLAVFG